MIRGWGNTWMWDNLAITGNLDLIAASIADNSCVAVTDGLYMKDLYPYLNSAAFVPECSKGRGRLMGSFMENTPNVGSYRGKLLGLMAIYLILQSLNEVSTDLQGLGQMDYHAKKSIWESDLNPEVPTCRFPLEPICVFLGRNNLTSGKGDELRFWVQKQLARAQVHMANILFDQQFDSVN